MIASKGISTYQFDVSVHGGDKRYPMGGKIEALPLMEAMRELAG